MARALRLAERGRGWVEPNPMVGCVLLKDGEVIGEGWHRAYGGLHAEREALAGSVPDPGRWRGCTAVVTLEPCGHHGKQPPCVDALLEAGVGRVVAAMADPAEGGGGAERLRAAGVDVEVGLMEGEARRLNRAWLKRLATGRPWVIGKWAQTLDGRVATSTGDSKWISGKASRRKVHELRAVVDAIVTGVGTVIVDDPSLTARDVEVRRVARRVVIDRSGRCPKGAKALREATVEGRVVPPAEVTSQTPSALLDRLGAEGCTNVLVEAGPGLMGAMLHEGLIDEAWAFIAGRITGATDALPIAAMPGRPIGRIADALPLTLESVERVGDDVWCRYLTQAGATDA